MKLPEEVEARLRRDISWALEPGNLKKLHKVDGKHTEAIDYIMTQVNFAYEIGVGRGRIAFQTELKNLLDIEEPKGCSCNCNARY